VKCAARGSLEMQEQKIVKKFTIWAPSYNFVGLYIRNWHVSAIGKQEGQHPPTGQRAPPISGGT